MMVIKIKHRQLEVYDDADRVSLDLLSLVLLVAIVNDCVPEHQRFIPILKVR